MSETGRRSLTAGQGSFAGVGVDAFVPTTARGYQARVELVAAGNSDFSTLSAVFTGTMDPEPWLAIQAVDRRQLLTIGGLSLVLSRVTFRRLEDPGLTLGESVAAVVRGSVAYFRSYYTARRVLPLDAYYRTVTDTELDRFVDHPSIYLDDRPSFDANADTWVRRKVAHVMDRGVFNYSPRSIAAVAEEHGVDIPVYRVNGSERIALPSDKAELKRVLRFLDEDFYSGPITETRYVSNSKRRAERR